MSKKNGKGGLLGLLGMAAAAAAGTYYLYGTKEGKEKRKRVAKFATEMKKEVMERVGSAKDVSEEGYANIVETVRAKYAGIQNIDTGELAKVADDIKGHWKNVKKQFKEGEKKA